MKFGIILFLVTSVVLFLQFFLDFVIEVKRKKILLGVIILVSGLLSVWIAFYIQRNNSNRAEGEHNRELIEQKKRFDKLDSINQLHFVELQIRNYDLKYLTLQNDSLKLQLRGINEKQNEFLLISQYSALETNKSRVALENMGLKRISRGISEIDKIHMIGILNIYKGKTIKIRTILGDGEAFQFALQIQEVFLASGWKTGEVSQCIYTGDMQGVYIEVKDNSFPKGSEAIIKAFKEINIKVVGNLNNNIGDYPVNLLIGRK